MYVMLFVSLSNYPGPRVLACAIMTAACEMRWPARFRR